MAWLRACGSSERLLCRVSVCSLNTRLYVTLDVHGSMHRMVQLATRVSIEFHFICYLRIQDLKGGIAVASAGHVAHQQLEKLVLIINTHPRIIHGVKLVSVDTTKAVAPSARGLALLHIFRL